MNEKMLIAQRGARKKVRSIDWTTIQLAYMKGDLLNSSITPTFQNLSDIYKVSRQSIARKCKDEDWSGERQRARKAIAEKTAEQIQKKEFKAIAESLTSINLHFDKTEIILGEMLEARTRERTIQTKTGSEKITEDLNPQDYKAIVATLRDIAKSKRELLDRASIEALLYDHRTALTNYAKAIAEIIKKEISDPVQLQRIFEAITEATRPPGKQEVITA